MSNALSTAALTQPGSAQATGLAGAGRVGSKQLGKDEFLKLLVTQLKNQSPLDPVQNEDFIAQLAQFSALENGTESNDRLGSILSLERLGQGAALVGRRVTYRDPASGEARPGIVSAVELRDGSVFLDMGGTKISIDNVLRVDGAVPSAPTTSS